MTPTHISSDEGYRGLEPFRCACGINWQDTPELWACKACQEYSCPKCHGKCFSCDEDLCAGCLSKKDYGDGRNSYCAACIEDSDANLKRCDSCSRSRMDLGEREERDDSVGYHTVQSLCQDCRKEYAA